MVIFEKCIIHQRQDEGADEQAFDADDDEESIGAMGADAFNINIPQSDQSSLDAAIRGI